MANVCKLHSIEDKLRGLVVLNKRLYPDLSVLLSKEADHIKALREALDQYSI
jgi:hypothetical protein